MDNCLLSFLDAKIYSLEMVLQKKHSSGAKTLAYSNAVQFHIKKGHGVLPEN